MKVNTREAIAGQPIKKVRDVLRKMRDGSWTREMLASEFGVNDASRIIAEMIKRDLLEKSKGFDAGLRYKLGDAASRLSAVSFLRRIDRKRAEMVVSKLLRRVEQINANETLLMTVREIRAFGSFVTGADDLGDVDVFYDLARKMPTKGMSFVEWNLKRAEDSGRESLSYIERLYFGGLEVKRLLKGGDPYLSLHDWGEYKEWNRGPIKTKVLYRAPKARTVPTKP